jgi:hypothetical protein
LRVAPPWWTNLPYAGFLFLSAAQAAFGELGFSSALPVVGQAAQEIAALLAEIRALDWLPPVTTPHI